MKFLAYFYPIIALLTYFFFNNGTSFDYLYIIIASLVTLIALREQKHIVNKKSLSLIFSIISGYLIADIITKTESIMKYFPDLFKEIDTPTQWFILFLLFTISLRFLFNAFLLKNEVKNTKTSQFIHTIFLPYLILLKILILIIIIFMFFLVVQPNDSFSIENKKHSIILKSLLKEEKVKEIVKPFIKVAIKKKKMIKVYTNSIGALDKMPNTMEKINKINDRKPIDISTEKGLKEYKKVQEEKSKVLNEMLKNLNANDILKKEKTSPN
jgi:hypothetical protein